MAAPNWRSRLSVKYDDGTSGPKLITPIDSFQPSFALNAEVLHSIEDTHIGVVYSPEQITFSMTVKAMGDVVARLTMLAIKGIRFQVVLEESDSGDQEWSFEQIVLDNCVITNVTPTSASISGAPSATFSGFSLGAKAKTTSDEGLLGALA